MHELVPKEILPKSLGGPIDEHEAAEHEIPTMMRGLLISDFGGYSS